MLSDAVLKHWGLERQPFVNELDDVDSLFMTPNYKEVVEQILQAARSQGFIYVIGDIGCGKTTLKKHALIKLQEEKKIRVHVFEEPEKERLLISDVYTLLLDELGVRRKPTSTAQKLSLLKKRLESRYETGEGVTTFIVIDEAQDLSYKAIAGLKKIYDTSVLFKGVVGICLFGTPELRRNIEKDERVESSAMRLSPVEVTGLGDYTVRYVKMKLKRAGGDPAKIFTQDALVAMITERRTMKEAGKIASIAMKKAFDMKKEIVTDQFIHHYK